MRKLTIRIIVLFAVAHWLATIDIDGAGNWHGDIDCDAGVPGSSDGFQGSAVEGKPNSGETAPARR